MRPHSGWGMHVIAGTQDTSKKCRKLGMRVKRQDMCHILVGAHDHNAALITVDAAQVENILVPFQVWAESLFIINEPQIAFRRAQQWVQIGDVRVAEPLLQYSADINHRINIGIFWRVTP